VWRRDMASPGGARDDEEPSRVSRRGLRNSREAQLEAGALPRMECGGPPDGLGVSSEGSLGDMHGLGALAARTCPNLAENCAHPRRNGDPTGRDATAGGRGSRRLLSLTRFMLGP